MGRRPTGRVTIHDVARAAGVSVSTVSRVIRQHPDVQEDTRAAVLAAIDRLQYRPSYIARALVSGETRLLALLVSDFTNPFYPQLARSIEEAADRVHYTVVVCNTRDTTADALRHLTRLLSQGLDGVIHAAAGPDEAAVLAALGDPRRIVFTNRPPRSRSVSYVISDNAAGAAALTSHLLSLGHRRIGFISGPSYARNATERLCGFRDTMSGTPDAEPLVEQGEFSKSSGERAVQKWLRSEAPPTAIIAINDSVALGAMEELIRLGLSVPDDIALAGFDGTDLAASPVLSLTSVDQHIGEMGRLSVSILLQQLGSTVFSQTREVLPTQLLIRRSTAGPSVLLPKLSTAPVRDAGIDAGVTDPVRHAADLAADLAIPATRRAPSA